MIQPKKRTRNRIATMAIALCILPAMAATASAAISAAASATPAAVIQPSAETQLVPSVLAGLSYATPEGAAPASQVLTIGVSVARPDTAGETQLYNELYDPASPLYHHFLTPKEFATEFGVSAPDTQAIQGWLHAGGLHVITSSPVGDYYTLSGTVAQLDHLFDVVIGRYSFDGTQFVANATAPSVPKNLPIDAVAGLDSFRKFSLSGLTTPKPYTAPAKMAAGTTFSGTMTPQDLWGAYDDPASDEGQGQTIGIFTEGEDDSVISQLRLFEAAEGFPKVPVSITETAGGTPEDYGDNTGSIEWYLDSQSSTGMAPKVSKLKFYTTTDLYDAEVFQDFDYWANDPTGPNEMNASFGECEEGPTNAITGPLAQTAYGTELGDELEPVGEPILRQATIEGRTVFSAAGDNGSGCPEVVVPVAGAGNGIAPQPIPIVYWPAASPSVVGVSGTVLTTGGTNDNQRVNEVSWTDGGGGASHFIPEPSFQQGVKAVNIPCVSTPSGDPYLPTQAPMCRGVPDVSDLSGNITGNAYFIYIDSEPSSEGGTSLASPLMMGQWARIQAAAPGGNLGFADEIIYRQAQRDYSRDFYDITQSEYGIGNGVYRPGPGWDYASGWGSLNVANFIHDVDGTDAARAQFAQAQSAVIPKAVCTSLSSSTDGNATDPVDVNLGNQPALDLTGAWLGVSSNGKFINAVLTGDSLKALPPIEATQGDSYYVAWLYNGIVYYAEATITQTGAVTYTSGNTGTPSKGGFNATPDSKATGSFTNSYIHIQVPVAEVGDPSTGSMLLYPQAFDQEDVGASTPVISDGLPFTVDSADAVVGTADSNGDAVKVGGC
jgi:pseudomonalisin